MPAIAPHSFMQCKNFCCRSVGLPFGVFTSIKTALPSLILTPNKSEKPAGTPVEKNLPSSVYAEPTFIRNSMQCGASARRISFCILCSSVTMRSSPSCEPDNMPSRVYSRVALHR